jgi:transposase-like protein
MWAGMDTYPHTLMEFEKQFATDEACRQYLEQLRWPEGFRCPRCGCSQAWRMGRGLWLCRQCRRQISVMVGTVFERSRLPLTLWFRAMWHITNQKNGASALTVQRQLGLGSYQTAWAWMHKLRRAMVRPGRDRLEGLVEVDESYLGGEKSGKRGRGAQGKALVLLAVQLLPRREIGRIRLAHVPDASGASLVPVLETLVVPGTQVRTDGWGGYNDLQARGYRHRVVRSSGEIGRDLLPACHRVASLLKRWLLGTHQGAVRHEHLAYYLDEFTFRFNRRTSASRGKLFYRLAQQAVQVEPAPYATLIAHHKLQRSVESNG